MWGSHDGMGWWMLFGGMGMLAFWAAVIWLVARGISSVGDERETRREQQQAPIEIVKRRFARGEITRDEFDDLMRSLE